MKQINPKLTKEQKQVVFDKATEAPFSGALLHNDARGDYVCANCGEVLFESGTKLTVAVAGQVFMIWLIKKPSN